MFAPHEVPNPSDESQIPSGLVWGGSLSGGNGFGNGGRTHVCLLVQADECIVQDTFVVQVGPCLVDPVEECIVWVWGFLAGAVASEVLLAGFGGVRGPLARH
jgi:hypothetical protein